LKSPVKILPSIAFRSSLVMINHVPLQRPTRGFMLRISITGAPTFKCSSNDGIPGNSTVRKQNTATMI
jgi:hypothetical protein